MHSIAHALNQKEDPVQFLQTIADLASVNMDLAKAVNFPDDNVSDLRALLQGRLSKCTSYDQTINALTHLMPKELVREVVNTRKEIATYDFSKMDKSKMLDSRTLRREAEGYKNHNGLNFDPLTEDEEEPESLPPKRRKRENVSTLAVGVEDEDDVLEARAHFEEVSALVAAAAHTRPCFFCRKDGHRVRECPELQDANGGTIPFCVFCRSKDHTVNSCTSLKEHKCKKCGKKGHSGVRCPTNTCSVCGELGHRPFQCPNKRSGSKNAQGR